MVLEVSKTQQDTNLGTPQTSSGTVKKEVPKTIFVGMTKAEAEEYNLLDEYNKANSDGVDGISEDEYKNYLEKNSNNVSYNVYVVKKGDTLSKIANKYGIRLEVLLSLNPNITNADLIEIGQKINLPLQTASTQTNKSNNSQNSTANNNISPKLISHMTLAQAEQAEKVVPGTLALFKSYAKDSTVLSEQTFATYKKSTHKKNELDKAAYAKLDSTLQVKVLKERIAPNVDSELLDQSTTGLSLDEVIKKLNDKLPKDEKLDFEKLKHANTEERGKTLAKAEMKVLSQECREDSPEFKAQYERLKSGKYTKTEIQELGLTQGVPLTEQQAKEYAAKAIIRKHMTIVATSTYEAGNKKDDETLMSVLHAFKEGMLENKDDPDFRFILSAIGVKSLSNPDNQAEGAKIVAQMTTDSATELDENTNFIVAETILSHASNDVIEEFISNNPNILDSVKEVISLMPEGAQKTELTNIVNKAIENLNDSGTTSSSRGISNPVQRSTDPKLSWVEDVAQQSAQLQQSQPVKATAVTNPINNSTSTISQEERDYATSLKIINKLTPVEQSKIKKLYMQMTSTKDKVKDYSNAHYVIQEAIEQYFNNMATTNCIIEMLSNGPEVEKFMLTHGCIRTN